MNLRLEEIALFPLRTVLFPGGLLPLRIFETRYTDMVARCLRQDLPFGVVLITEGSETGSRSVSNVGTSARIIDWSQGEDGLLHVTAMGLGRFALEESFTQPDGLHIGRISRLSEPSALLLDESDRDLADIAARLMEHGADEQRIRRNEYADAGWISARLAELLPLPLELKQRCLEMNEIDERLALIRSVIRQEGKS